MKILLEEILQACAPYSRRGKLADYIPELSLANPDDFGICLVKNEGVYDFAGDYSKKFTAQSLIKPLILLLALMDRGIEEIESVVGIEATGKPFDAFNYSDRALRSEHVNPMINIGAIALCTMIKGKNGAERFERLLSFASSLTSGGNLTVNEAVYKSEKATGNKNRALVYMLKAHGLVDGDAEDILDIYFRACSIEVCCKDLAEIGLFLANHGRLGDKAIVPLEYARYVNAIMAVCGMYDGSGEFALRVGVPAKSGVGGGIMACVPGKMGIGIYSPALDKKGNSVAGRKVLEIISERFGLSIF